MERSRLYIEKPTHEQVLEAVEHRLRKIGLDSSLGEVILQAESEFDAYIAIVVPKACPACLYDVNAPLEGTWETATRDELMENLPEAWMQFDTRLVVGIIDRILELGVGESHRFMKSADERGPIYWITSARMICFFHSSIKTEVAHDRK